MPDWFVFCESCVGKFDFHYLLRYRNSKENIKEKSLMEKEQEETFVRWYSFDFQYNFQKKNKNRKPLDDLCK